MKPLSLNTQKAFQPTLAAFLRRVLESDAYDFLLLQEVTEKVLPLIEGIGAYTCLGAFNEERSRRIPIRTNVLS